MFEHLGNFARKWGAWALLACALASVPVFMYTFPLRVEMDLSSLFPKKDPTYQGFKYFQENFGIVEMLVAVSREDGAEAHAKMRGLAEWAKKSKWFTSAELLPLPRGLKGTMLMAFPRQPSTDHKFCAAMLADMRWEMARTGTRAELTGSSAMATEGLEHILQDMNVTTLLSFAAILAILFIFIRDMIFPIFAVVPLIIGIIWTMAFCQFRYGAADLLSATLPTTLLGIGIDYAVYIRNSRREFPEHEEGVWGKVFGRIGPPMLIGVTTTAAGILALCAARLTGMSHTGLVGGTGIIAIWALILLTLPALLEWRERLGLRVRPPSDRWIAWVAGHVAGHRRLTIAAFVLVSLPLLYEALHLGFDMNPRNYRDPTVPSLRVFKQFEKDAGISLEMLVLAAPTVKAERAVLEQLRPMVGNNRPFGFMDSFSERLDRPGANPDLTLFRGKDKRMLIMLYPRQDPYEGQRLQEMVTRMEEITERAGGNVTACSGMPLVWNALMQQSKRDLVRTTLTAAALVALALALLMRRLRSIMAALVPLAGSMVWMLGVMHWAGFQFSLISAVSMPLVLGLGIGYGVYIVHRLRDDSVERAVVIVGRAIIVSASTTAVAFFALCASHNPAVAGMGLAAGTGITSCLLWSLLFLPAWAAEFATRAPEVQR